MSQTLTIAGAAELHGVSTKAIRHAIKLGALKAEKLPGVTGPYLLRPKDVEKWLALRPKPPYSRVDYSVNPELVAKHHAITHDCGLAVVVVACKCSPEVPRDEQEWARHLLDVMSGTAETSGAIAS